MKSIISNFLVVTFIPIKYQGIKTRDEVLALKSNSIFAVHAIADSFKFFKLDAFLSSKSEAKMSIW